MPEDRRGQGLLLSKSVRENLTLSVIQRFSDIGLLSTAKRGGAGQGDGATSCASRRAPPEQLAGTLSGGNQQKVIFGKMLLTEARVLLLYDPTRGVDVGTKGEIFQLMRDLAAKGYAILFYSSDLPELVHVADRVLVLRNGRVAATLEGERHLRGGHPARRDVRRGGARHDRVRQSTPPAAHGRAAAGAEPARLAARPRAVPRRLPDADRDRRHLWLAPARRLHAR